MAVTPTTRLALVACRGPHEGPWLRGRGNEVAIRVSHLAEGERVEVDLDHRDSEPSRLVLLANGDYPLSAFRRARVSKYGGVGPTTVELVIA